MVESGGVWVGLLGPLEVSAAGRPVELTAGRLRTLLAMLAMSAGRAVSIDRLATGLWGEEPPEHTRRAVQTYVARLRGVLGGDVVGAGPAAYLLNLAPDQVDALRFERLLDRAGRVQDASAEGELLGEALALWRGSPFEDLASPWLERAEAPRLLERYLAGVERRADLDVAAGHAAESVPSLYAVTRRYPLRESLWVRLLLALIRSGRKAEALQQYETIRVRLVEELGTDPGPELQQVYADLLAGTPPEPASDTQPVAASRPATVGRLVVPRQLPADIDGFAGREAELKTLNSLIGNPDPGATGPVVISAITGTAGVGKTTLAVHFAHQVSDQFPDGQLYVNLRGFGPSEQVMQPAEAIRGFLDALGVPPHRLPPYPDAQPGLYRSILAGKRILVLLDNARDADQVRPLLPGAAGCLVIVTSRNQLSLVATEAAHPLPLDLLPVDGARQLLVHRLGADRIAAEAAAADQIITYCARLPLALAIVAARAATYPTFPLHTLASQIHHTQPGLDAFAGGDPTTDARTVFSWSYQTLSPEAARLFRLLALHPGPDISAFAAASLAGLPLNHTTPLLAELTRAHLVIEHTPGRRTLHDLLRSYANELTHSIDTGAEQRAARHRMLDHYLHTAHTAAILLNPHRDPLTLASPLPGVTPESLANHEQALAWSIAEHLVLSACVAYAAESGLDTHTWQLAWTLWDAFERQGRWLDWATTQRIALDAARRLDDPAATAHAHRSLGTAYTWLGRYQDAHPHLQAALDLCTQLGDDRARARADQNLAFVLGRQERYAEALNHAQRAIDLARATGDRAVEALGLENLGWDHAHLGNYRQALDYCEQALVLSQAIGLRATEAYSWDTLGYANHHLGDHRSATACYQRALTLHRELGNRHLEADTLANLGDAHLAAGTRAAARAAWHEALAILEELSHPDTDRVRARLEGRLTAP